MIRFESVHQIVSKMEETDHSAMATTICQIPIIPPKDFPSDVSKWMKINASPKMALKLMQCCKYFKHSNGFPYLVVESVRSYLFYWCLRTYNHPVLRIEDIHSLPKKLWITESIQLMVPGKTVSTLILKSAVCNVHEIILLHQQLTINEFKILTNGGNVESFLMEYTVIRDDMGQIVPFEDICECLPNAQKIGIGSDSPSIISLEAAETKISTKLEKLILGIQPLKYDVQKLLAYMKGHQKIFYFLTFYGITDEEYAQTLAPSVQKMVEEWSPEFDSPDIIVKKQKSFTIISFAD